MITALKLLKDAAAKGWTFKVVCDGEVDYKGSSAVAAWAAVKATEEVNVVFYDAAGAKLGVAAMSAHDLDPEETLIDHTCDGGEFEALCDAVIKAM